MNAPWGPAVLVVVGYLVAMLFQRHQIQDLREVMNHRFEDLARYLDQRFKNLEDRLGRLEHPVLRG
ncbi:MAG TPA: hypothetical protein VKM93_01115 [Terriglobia bacterium]|nr:hypothetical protein [Terriglobia bacterium]